MKRFRHKITSYVSEIDKFLRAFNKAHKRSPAQQAEYDKYQGIYKLRDEAQPSSKKRDKKIWDNF